jgi:pimeloyl-ACP methyl ester carboxylesterase
MDPNDTLVIGLLGGFERWDDANRGVRKLVLKLRQTPGVHAESVANRNRRTALKYVLKALDTDGNRKLDVEEKRRANIVIFGQSLGGAQTVALARDLNRRGIPVKLTVQIDSFGLRDSVIPPNVRKAANFYQREILTFRGEDQIRAADPAKTAILGNVQFHYPPFLPSYSRPESWARRRLGGAHAKLEADPILWAQVEAMIRQAISEKQ